ncbi:MAG: ABC transporter ATP-binding protein [Deltaproteobacteria bacterium]|nr:ABC transporter ATP-binding protein [Deltaproteobacteria bacterium]
MIELINIAKKFKNKVVLHDISLSVADGEIMVLLGASGCGKTTQLRIIAGLIRQDSGDIRLNNKVINDLQPQERNIGFVFQDYALFPHKNVFENVAFGLRIRELPKNEVNSRVHNTMERLEIEDLKEEKTSHLSGGQKQRIALARALVMNPDVLLLDEPLSALDPILREKLREELKNILKNIGVTGIYVTHDLTEAMVIGDDIAIMNEGEIQQIGTPDEVFYRPKTEFAARFVGVRNILKGQIIGLNCDEATIEITNGSNPFKISALKYPLFERKKKIHLCIHPEDVVLGSEKGDNSIRGIITGIIQNGPALKIIVDIAGLKLYATTTRRLLNYEVNDEVWVSFSRNACHPLCGKKCRSPALEIPASCVRGQ